MPAPGLLYLTVDGVLQPLGYSQVCRVLLGLGRRGFSYRLLSLERGRDLANAERVSALQRELLAQNIAWSYEPYDEAGTKRAAALNLARLGRRAASIVRRSGIELVHARAYHSAAIALSLKNLFGTPYLFDARGRWIDERLLGGRWFTNPRVERAARFVERSLYGNAAGLVTLTELHADDIRRGDFGAFRGVPISVVTTCADFADFPLERRYACEPDPAVPAAVGERLRGKLVLGMVGSTNAFYRHDESFALAQLILAQQRDAHLLIVTAQTSEFTALARRAGIPDERLTVVSATHRDMPAWLCRMTWAIQLLNAGTAKRGSMPTKLAEFLAAGVRPIHFGCNDEVSDWVRRTGSGVVLSSLTPEALLATARLVADSEPNPDLLEHARRIAQPHFDLNGGLDRYEGLLRELGFGPAPIPTPSVLR